MSDILSLSFSNVPQLPEWVAVVEAEAELVETAGAVVSAASFFTLNTVAAGLTGLFMQCDDPRSCGDLNGVSRFAPKASADGAVVTPAADPVTPLPESVTPTEAETLRTIAEDLRQQLEAANHFTPLQRKHLESWLKLAAVGEVRLLEFVRGVGNVLEKSFLDHLKQLGIPVQEVIRDGNRYYVIPKVSVGVDDTTLQPLLTLLLLFKSRNPDWNWAYESKDRLYTLTIPAWDTWLELMKPHLDSIVWVSRDMEDAEINQLHAQGKLPVGLFLKKMVLFADLKMWVHAFVFAIHDLYHVLNWAVLPEQLRRLIPILHEVLWRVSGEENIRLAFSDLLKTLLDMDYGRIPIVFVLSVIDMRISEVTARMFSADRHFGDALDRTLKRSNVELRRHPLPGVSKNVRKDLLRVVR